DQFVRGRAGPPNKPPGQEGRSLVFPNLRAPARGDKIIIRDSYLCERTGDNGSKDAEDCRGRVQGGGGARGFLEPASQQKRVYSQGHCRPDEHGMSLMPWFRASHALGPRSFRSADE